MNTTYKHKDKTYANVYELSEALGKDGVFIPLSLPDAELETLGVTIIHTEEPIEVIKQRKILELKYQRDAAEVEPIEYGDHVYDYDSKARDRINAAIIALDVQGEGAKISWTTADNQDAIVTAAELRAIVAAVAVRSNLLHIAYRTASTADEVRAVCME